MAKSESKNATKEEVEDEFSEFDQSKKRKCMHSELEKTKMKDRSSECCTYQNLAAAKSKNDASHSRVIKTDASSTLVDLEGIQKTFSRFIVCANLSFSAVKLPSFIYMLQRLNPDYDYKRLSQHRGKRVMMADYVIERDFVLHELGEAPGKISLSLDYWTVKHTDDEYLCITAHWIDKDWKMQKKIIYFKGITLPISGISLADEVATCLSEWNIDGKICTITLDNSHNNDVMATFLKSKSSIHKNLLCGGVFFQVKCFRDIFNWIVLTALKKVENIVSKIRNGVKYIKLSASRKKKFYDMAEKIFHLDTSRKLKTDVRVRWNSTFLMLERAIFYREVFQHWEQNDNSFGMFVPSDAEWKKIEEVNKFLKTFYDVICLFSATKSPTSDIYFLQLWLIYRCLSKASIDTPEFMSDMIAEIVKKFQNYWEEHVLLLSCAVVLDPRFKLRFVKFCYSKIYDNVEERINTVVNTLQALFDHYKEMSTVTSISTTEGSGDCDSISLDDYDLDKGYDLYMRSIVQKSELQSYLDLDGRSHFKNPEFDILHFWNWQAMSSPALASLARDILAIPISVVASESVPCIGKKVINTWMSSLNEKTLQALVCLEDWCRAKGGSSILGFPVDDVESSDDEDDIVNAG